VQGGEERGARRIVRYSAATSDEANAAILDFRRRDPHVNPIDLVVIGGGITGAGVARLAARNGLSVALVERGDLACGTSSHSSHMLHGGLRYLEHGAFSLVRESLEQRAEVARMAPALAQPRRFLVPLFRGGRVSPLKLRAGLTLYDWLAGARAMTPHGMLSTRDAQALEPGLETRGLRAAALYSDVVMDDARLAVAVARDAAEHGAAIHTHCEVAGAHPAPEGEGIELELRDHLAGGSFALVCRCLVNATGPWTDATRRMLLRGLLPGRPDPPPLLGPSRGTHLVFPAITNGHGLLVMAEKDGRVMFAVPFGDHTLVGTTEVAVGTPPADAELRPSIDEVRYLRREIARVLPGAAHVPALAVFAGVRPLLRAGGDPGRASREHRVVEDGTLITLCGGKYTTFRVMARDALRAVMRLLDRREPLRDPPVPMPAPVAEGVTVEQRAAFAVEQEFARRLDDVMRRRTRWWLEPDRGRIVAPRVAAALAEQLGWSGERMRDELHAYEEALRDEEALLQRAVEDA